MVFLENLLIAAGIGFDIFAAFEIQGAMLAKVKRRSLIIACAVVASVELLFYFVGYTICRLLDYYEILDNPSTYGDNVVCIVLALLGGRLLIKAIRREFVHETRRDSMKVWDYIRIIVVSSLYTLAAGAACGLIGTSVLEVIILLLVLSVIMVIGGIYTGMHFGFETKTVAYVIGTVLLWAASLEVLLTKVLGLF